MCEKAVKKPLLAIIHVANQLKTQQRCEKVIQKNLEYCNLFLISTKLEKCMKSKKKKKKKKKKHFIFIPKH